MSTASVNLANVNKLVLSQPNVHIRNQQRVNALIENIAKEGHSKLQVIADFDRTLTRCKDENGKAFSTCHNTLEECKMLPLEYRQKSKELLNHYYKIEVDPNMCIEEKIPHMVEWWEKSHALLMQYKLSKPQITDIVLKSNIMLRDGVSKMFSFLHKRDIPLMIFSAGIGDIIEIAVEHQCKLYDNIRVVSNYMRFDDKDVLVGFQDTLIHTFNKNERSIRDAESFGDLDKRTNIVLLGDSLGDLKMAEGAKNANHILKIGYLNGQVESFIETYKDQYDIVITGDGDCSLVQSILDCVEEK